MTETGTVRTSTEERAPLSAREALLALAAEFEREANGHDSALLAQAFMRAAVMASDRARLLPPDANGDRPVSSGEAPGQDRRDAPRAAQPPGEFSRVELPGYVSWVGWVTEETFAGAGVLVVRDASGTVRARVSAGAFRQVIPMPPPPVGESHYDGQLALPAGDEDGAEDAWADDRDEGPF